MELENLDNFDEEFLKEHTDNEESSESEITDKTPEEVEEEIVEEQPTGEKSTEVVEKPTAEDKKEYTFANLRKENKELKENNNSLKSQEELVKLLASEHGYTDINLFIKDVNAARMEKEAKSKGIDPKLYRENQELSERIRLLETESKQKERESKIISFDNQINTELKELGIDITEGRKKVLDRLDEAGFTLDHLATIPNSSAVIRGVLMEEISEKIRKEQISKVKEIEEIADDSIGSGAGVKSKYTLDEILAEEFKSL